MRRARSVAAVVLSFFLPALAADPPDTAVNPVTGKITAVDTLVQSGVEQVRCTTKISSSLREVDLLGHPDFNGHSPRITASPSGALFVTWWSDAPVPQVLLAVQTYPDMTWSDPAILSDTSEISRNPQIVHDGTRAWVAYTIDAGSGVSEIAVTAGDGGEPWPGRGIVGETTFAGGVDLSLDTDGAGHLWITWIDSETAVGWTAYDDVTATWTTPTTESYANDSVEDARARIAATVTGH
jgi:hypothetical protein